MLLCARTYNITYHIQHIITVCICKEAETSMQYNIYIADSDYDIIYTHAHILVQNLK